MAAEICHFFRICWFPIEVSITILSVLDFKRFKSYGMAQNKLVKYGRLAFDVALSFAEEDREFVDSVAERLKRMGIRVYYDKYERINSWGKNLTVYLDEIYRTKARFCVLFISRHYNIKRWSQFEKERALAKSFFMEYGEYILPYRLDDSTIQGLDGSIAYLSKETCNEEELARAIAEKVYQSRRKGGLFLQMTRRLFASKFRIAIVAVIVIGAAVFTIRDYLTPVDMLSRRLYERSKIHFRSACRDGWASRSRGRGTCSWHGGLYREIDSVTYDKTMEQCRKEAALISLFGE